MVSIFLEESPVPGPMRAAVLKPLMGRILGATLGKRMTSVDAKPGLSLQLLPDAELPPQFLWAAPDPAVAAPSPAWQAPSKAKARLACRRLQGRRCARALRRGPGKTAGLGLQWLEQTLAPLAREKDRAAARLALLAALAAYRVDDATIASFRKHFPEDRQFVAAAAWGSFEAVKRLSEWIAGPSAKSSMRGGEAMQYGVNG